MRVQAVAGVGQCLGRSQRARGHGGPSRPAAAGPASQPGQGMPAPVPDERQRASSLPLAPARGCVVGDTLTRGDLCRRRRYTLARLWNGRRERRRRPCVREDVFSLVLRSRPRKACARDQRGDGASDAAMLLPTVHAIGRVPSTVAAPPMGRSRCLPAARHPVALLRRQARCFVASPQGGWRAMTTGCSYGSAPEGWRSVKVVEAN